MRPIDLSVIIVSFNTEGLLGGCINSILKNKEGIKTEIIVVDNASTDNSRQDLKKLAGQKAITLIENKKNVGFARAVNQGIKASSGKFVLLFNSDAILKRYALERLIEFSQKKNNQVVIGVQLLNVDGSVQPSCYWFPSFWGAFEEFWLGRKGRFQKFAPRGKKPVVVDAVIGAAFFLSRKVIDKVGLLDGKFFLYFEDLDYCQRVKKAGMAVYYLPTAQAIHFHGQSGKKLGGKPNRWLKDSSRLYHGTIKHYLINFIIWSGQKWQRLRKFF